VTEAVPAAPPLVKEWNVARQRKDVEGREEALIHLYLCLHAAGTVYQSWEAETLSGWSGILCHPGGLLPLLLADHLIDATSTTADLGAGNGLQGLLLQVLCPHRQSLLVEISEQMIEVGRLYQRALGIGADRVLWMHQDIAGADTGAADLIYLYRPARPMENGNKLYRILGEKLSSRTRALTIVSMADCLGPFLNPEFGILYHNEFLKIFSSRGAIPPP